MATPLEELKVLGALEELRDLKEECDKKRKESFLKSVLDLYNEVIKHLSNPDEFDVDNEKFSEEALDLLNEFFMIRQPNYKLSYSEMCTGWGDNGTYSLTMFSISKKST